MSFSSEYAALRKKRKKNEEEEASGTSAKTSKKSPFAEQYAELRSKRSSSVAEDDDIAPVRNYGTRLYSNGIYPFALDDIAPVTDDRETYAKTLAYRKFDEQQAMLKLAFKKKLEDEAAKDPANRIEQIREANKGKTQEQIKMESQFSAIAAENEAKKAEEEKKKAFESTIENAKNKPAKQRELENEILKIEQRKSEQKEAQEEAKEEEEKRTWFQADAFKDGYDFGDITKSIGASLGDIAVNAIQGLGSMGEGVVDLVAYMSAYNAARYGQKAKADDLREWAQKDVVGDFVAPAKDFLDGVSFLGDKSDSVSQGLGQIAGIYLTGGLGEAAGLGSVGATALTTGTMFASSAGSGIGEAYASGASDKQAMAYGALKGFADAGSELIFGGIGKGINALGISRGISSLDDMFAKKLSQGISNQVVKNLVQYGVKASAEGFEEIISGVGSAIAQKLTYKSDEELRKLIDDQDLFEQFVIGTVTSALVQSGYIPGTKKGSLRESNKTGRDFITGYTQSEQSVIDRVFEDRLSEMEEAGEELSEKDKKKLLEEVQSDLERGYISTDVIDEVIGGDSYKAWRDADTKENEILEEYERLADTPSEKLSLNEQKRRDELDSRIEELRKKTESSRLRAELDNKLSAQLKGSRLDTSYIERGRKREAFTADLSHYENEAAKKSIQNLIDAKYANNTGAVHDFADAVAKLAEASGKVFSFVNNEQIREMGKAVEGRIVNGFVTEDGIAVNLDSPKAWEFIVGHEITHTFEKAKSYSELHDALKAYARSKGEWDSRLKELTELYEGQDADVEAELVADLVGEYLFGDSDFISSLAAKNPNVVQKIYAAIKHLLKTVTAGSKQARQLERAKYAFEKAMREAGKAKVEGTEYSLSGEVKNLIPANNVNKNEIAEAYGGDGDVKYSLSADSEGRPLTEGQQEYFKDSKVRDENGALKVMYHGTPNGDFTVFKDGTYFTENKWYADLYQNPGASSISYGKSVTNPKTYEVYLDIKKPFDISDPEARSIYINDYIKGGNAAGINPYLSDAEYDKINSIDWTEGEDLREFLKENYYDYDGLVLDEGATGGYGEDVKYRGKSYVIFDHSQVKNVDNVNPTLNPDIRFSLSKAVEESGNLIAMHNVNADKLMSALRLGGLPSPSVAITKADITHDNYGDITMILPKESIDPQADSRNKVYGSDAWTPTSSNARTEYEVNYENMRAFEKKLAELSRQVAGGAFVRDSMVRALGIDDVSDQDAKRISERLASYDEVRAAYLGAMGKNVEPEYKAKEYSKFGNAALQKYIDRVGVQHLASVVADSYTGDMTAIRAEEEAVRQIIRDDYAEKRAYSLNRRPELKEERINKYMENNVSIFTIEDFIKDAWQFYEKGGAVTEEIDRLATSGKLREAVSTSDVIAWLEPQVAEFLGEPGIYNGKDIFTPSGRRRSFSDTHWSYTAENIVKAMQLVSARGETWGGTNANTLIATATPSYKSIDEMHADEGRLRLEDKEAYEAILNELDEALTSVEHDIIRTTKHHSDNTYDEEQIIGGIIAEAATGARTVAAVRRAFSKEGYSISEVQAGRILALYNKAASVPTGYFESKPERVVGFDEVAVVIIPNNTDPKLKQELLNHGLSIAEYDPDVEGSRKKVVNNFEQYKFSLSRIGEDVADRNAHMRLNPLEDVLPVREDAARVQDTDRMPPVREDAETENSSEAAEDVPITTVRERLEKKKTNYESELESNRTNRKQAWANYDDAIAQAQAQYDDLKNKDTKKANNLLRRIDRYMRQQKNVDADYEKRISDIESRIGRTSEKIELNEQRKAQLASDIASLNMPTQERKSSDKSAKSLTKESGVNQKKEQRGILSLVKEYVLDNGMVFEDESKKHHNRQLEADWNMIRNARSMAQRFLKKSVNGRRSIVDIEAEVRKKGLTQDFYDYMHHMLNVDRMSLESKAQAKIADIIANNPVLGTLLSRNQSTGDILNDPLFKQNADTLKADVDKILKLKETKNHPVFGDPITSEISAEEAAKLEKAHPEFKSYAEEIYANNRELRDMLVEEGIITPETAQLWEEMYPHYVPIRRAKKSNGSGEYGRRQGVNAPLKRAEGGNTDIEPLFNSIALRAEQTYKAVLKNRFGVELMNTIQTPIVEADNKLGGKIDTPDGVENIDSLLMPGDGENAPTFTVFENGERVTFEITEEMYDAMRPTGDALSYTSKGLQAVSNLMRSLLTEYNLPFMVGNAIKDAQDILMNSQHPARTYAAIPKAIAQIASNGKYLTEYMDYGGQSLSFFDKQKMEFVKKNVPKEVFMTLTGLNAISKANNVVELMPRLAEYIASREAGRSIEISMLDAARVTTNFAAGGKLTKLLNRNGATFLNASVQGFMQNVRNIREAKMNGFKGWAGLAARTILAGVPALILNNLIWDDDDEYEELSDYIKQNYYIVGKFGDGKFVRIPKGRTVAVIQDAFMQMSNAITGDDEVDFESFAQLVINNLVPNNPYEDNVASPIVKMMMNETWYGGDLVPTRLQDSPKAEQYDETTDAISKWLGEKLNFSPYKINYLLDQYTGGIGDILLPMITPESETGDDSVMDYVTAPFRDKFTTDSVLKNQNVSDFYDLKDELNVNANSSKATDDDVLKNKYMNSMSDRISELQKQKREIQARNDLSKSEKYDMTRDLQKEIVALTKEAIDSYENLNQVDDNHTEIGGYYYEWYTPEEGEPYWRKMTDSQKTKYLLTKDADGHYVTDGNVHYRLGDDGKWEKISDKDLARQNEVTKELGITPDEYWSKTETSFFPVKSGEYEYAYENPENYTVAKAVGGYDAYKSYSKELSGIKSDKDENGKVISGSRKEKVLDYINGLDIDYGEKIILFKNEYNADDTYNYDIINYLNSRDDISYSEMETILKELGFDVDSEGNVSW